MWGACIVSSRGCAHGAGIGGTEHNFGCRSALTRSAASLLNATEFFFVAVVIPNFEMRLKMLRKLPIEYI